MRYGLVLLLLALAAMVGWFAPRPSAPDEAGVHADTSQPVASATPAAGDAKRRAWLAGATLVTRQGDGHFYIDAGVAGSQTRFLVDSGASVVALTGTDARAAGLDWNEDDVAVIGRGASGPVRGVRVRLSEVDLDGFVARDVDAVIIPEGLEVSLLGQSFLNRLTSVSVDGNQMTLTP